MTVTAQIQKLWQEHLSLPFPKGCGGAEVEGIDLVMLDADTAGCVSTFINNNGRLDSWRTQVLKNRLDDLVVVTKELDGEALDFFVQIKMLVKIVLEEIGDVDKNF